ncbi:uroporphyrinogen-III C-methyltransferase [Thioclava sp. SK-1]|uniref:uroporphyrinogen-III C-methyltransferase n=1 Tax=Thioclava sp. SK-1 TaxID=1889770 RepID=UPI000826DD67|nr:uroporphyrinogen-III C-methyltransferase [Thioclava sp. SK-1]OCX65995.1 uroporphyrinogen-III C-methyltransferase [Thioclava sp. SK-1]
MAGFVSFVSAGPGDPELLTLKAVDRMGRADVVLFDDLASGPVLAHAGAQAELIAVGKRAGKPSTKQDHVNALLVAHAQAGKRVVRLKSGDSGLFGRLEEELVALRDTGIASEIIPGVPSACAAAAAAGIPLTRRLSARRVQFLTGADVTGGLPGTINWPALADAQATTVVFMGKRTFPKLAEGLIAHGLPGTTPALLAEAVGRAEQMLHRMSVADLAAHLRDARTDQPALILYGPLADDMGVVGPENT